jgi:hypothetical protein
LVADGGRPGEVSRGVQRDHRLAGPDHGAVRVVRQAAGGVEGLGVVVGRRGVIVALEGQAGGERARRGGEEETPFDLGRHRGGQQSPARLGHRCESDLEPREGDCPDPAVEVGHSGGELLGQSGVDFARIGKGNRQIGTQRGTQVGEQTTASPRQRDRGQITEVGNPFRAGAVVCERAHELIEM